MALINNLHAQDKIDTAYIHVDGMCGMCKERIETAAYSKGVKKATWEKQNHTLTLIYRTDKTSPETIGDRIAKAGHGNQYQMATDEDYTKLHFCCKYRSSESH